MTTYLPFGHTITINSKVYSLVVSLTHLLGGTVHRFTLMWPEEYRSELKNDSNNEIGEVMLQYLQTKDDIHVEIFHILVNSSDMRIVATEHELKALKGIGKKLMCFSLLYTKSIYPLITNNTVISLNAGGIESFCDLQFYLSLSNNELLSRIKSTRIRKQLTQSFDNEKPYHIRLASKACMLESNENLINYYRKTYGLRTVEEEYDIGAEMTATYGVVMSNC